MARKRKEPPPPPECPKCGETDEVAHWNMTHWICRRCRVKFLGRLFYPGDRYAKYSEGMGMEGVS